MEVAESIVYIERPKGLWGVVMRGARAVFVGAELHREPEKYRKSAALRPYAAAGFHFFFEDDAAPEIYAAPWMCIVGHDGAGGLFATPADDFTFERGETLYYVSPRRALYEIALSPAAIAAGDASWRTRLAPSNAARIFASRAEAEAEFEIRDAADFGMGEGE